MGLILPLKLCRDPEHTQSQQICPLSQVLLQGTSASSRLLPSSWIGCQVNPLTPTTASGAVHQHGVAYLVQRPLFLLVPWCPGRALCHSIRTGPSPRGARSQPAKRSGVEFTGTFAPALVTGPGPEAKLSVLPDSGSTLHSLQHKEELLPQVAGPGHWGRPATAGEVPPSRGLSGRTVSFQ